MVAKRAKNCTSHKSLPLPRPLARRDRMPSVPLTPTADVVGSVYRYRQAVGAFNVIILEHAEAVITGAEAAGCPVICQISENSCGSTAVGLSP